MMLAAPSQLTWVDEMTRHEGANVNCSSPEVIVLSEYVPSALAVHVPDTWSDPVTGTDGQPAPASDRSSWPLTLRQDDVTVQAPAALPPHGATLEQAAGPPPLLPPAPPVFPLLPPGPPPLAPVLQPLVAIIVASAAAPMNPRGFFCMDPQGKLPIGALYCHRKRTHR